MKQRKYIYSSLINVELNFEVNGPQMIFFFDRNEICEGNSSIKLCPQCDYNCPYLDIRDTCTHTRITYLFDNVTTVLFTVFMCFWGQYCHLSKPTKFFSKKL